jgi:hypothetical protein
LFLKSSEGIFFFYRVGFSFDTTTTNNIQTNSTINVM